MRTHNPHMRTYTLQADVCKALANPIRIHVLELLANREQSVEELAKLVSTGQSNLSQHLAALRQQKLVVPRRSGMNVYYSLASPKIAEACSLIRQLIAESLTRDHRAITMAEASA